MHLKNVQAERMSLFLEKRFFKALTASIIQLNMTWRYLFPVRIV